jgi:post-segregation antitoxin (ccd killing protein)
LRLASATVDAAIAASLRQLAADNFAMEGKAHVAQQQQQIQPRGLERPKASDE